jgi:hypothetical protein
MKMKLVRMLPFLEDEELKELVDAILNNELEENSISVMEIVPFLEEEDTNRLFQAAIEEKIDVNPVVFFPFLEKEVIDQVIEKIQSGEITTISIDSITPFLDDNQIKKIFKNLLNSMKKKQ